MLRLTYVIDMIHILRAGISFTYLQFASRPHIIARNGRYLLGHSGRKEQGSALCWCFFENDLQIIFEAHIEHLIGLIEHQIFDIGKHDFTSSYQINQTPWSGYDNLWRYIQLTELTPNILTAIYRYHLQL